jgi:hypothetical protein
VKLIKTNIDLEEKLKTLNVPLDEMRLQKNDENNFFSNYYLLIPFICF